MCIGGGRPRVAPHASVSVRGEKNPLRDQGSGFQHGLRSVAVDPRDEREQSGPGRNESARNSTLATGFISFTP